MQDLEKWLLLAWLQLAPRCIFSNSPCIFVKGAVAEVVEIRLA